MYRLGHQIRHHYWPYIVIGIVVVCGLVAAIVAVSRLLTPHTSLTQSHLITKHISANTPSMQHITKVMFAVSIPTSWQAVPPPQTQPVATSWAGVSADGSGRRLDVYIDTIPTTLAVNRLLPVQISGDTLETTGMVSDNCVNFTDRSTESADTGTAPAKWGGVNFICDMANYERDVVAIGSTAGINTVSLTGPKTGTHRALLVYTDNSISPDFSVLTSIVQSFQIL